MKVFLCRLLPLSTLLTIPASSWALTSVESTTILRLEQRDAAGSKKDVAPLTQFLGLDLDRLSGSSLSLHFYGWGRLDLAEKSYNTDQGGGSVTYGYLQYRPRDANAELRLGRFFVHEGIVNEQVDGVGARSDLPFGLAISAFGGATVHTVNLPGEESDGKGDGLFGGRVSYRYRGVVEVGLSGVYESAAPSLATHAGGNHRLVGGDLWLAPHSAVELTGHSSYNTETSQVAEHSYLLNVRPVQELTVSARYEEERDRSYFYTWALFSGAALDPADRSRSIGASASYRIRKGELFAEYRRYKRELGTADRFGGEAKFSFADNRVRAGGGYHYLRADQSFAISGTQSPSYHAVRGYLMTDTPSYFGALDLTAYLFKEKIFGRKSAWEGTASGGYHLTRALALSGDVAYGSNPQFSDEVRAVVRLTYNMAYDGKGGTK
ncbi:hypothetical protein LPW11_06580 [Geomonas sp. RF6]|uniref:hypothetical protein n=1 Tax=Geomonas sp. RF6 TaxID=2897342 RepID=UPI001E412176|nr:hypothetical protein [Geomonas sp. RF6]UFS71854.1 hypothetical protein LPW11_06580 [Geomonas sp. RF6]